jgi:outer membrane immunogenic protein
MKKLWLIAVAGLALSTTAAFAADLGQPYYKAPPPPPPVALPTWTGFYLGINGGFGWNNHTGSLFCADDVACPEATGDILKPNGGLAGGQIGYNWQSGIVVYGLEADIQWADIHDSATVVTPDGVDTFDANQKLNWFGTVRGRIGIAPWSNNALLYATGGLIYGGQKVSASFDDEFVSDSSTRTGGTVGAGLEYLFTPNLSGKIEGLWYDMGSTDLFINDIDAAHFRFQGVIVRAGLNWHFSYGGGPVETHY